MIEADESEPTWDSISVFAQACRSLRWFFSGQHCVVETCLVEVVMADQLDLP